MDVPGIVRDRLGDERQMTSVNVGGDDRVYVTPPRTLVYHASGLFSRESVTEYPHDARRFDVSADRREATFAFEYDGSVDAFSVPRERIETVLPPVLAGVLRSTDRIDDDESVEESYRFGERTLVVTDKRVLTSVGEAVWDRDHESYAYEDITDLDFEDGLRIEVDGRSRRIELTGDERREAYDAVETALLAYHGVDSIEAVSKAKATRDSGQSSVGTPEASEATRPSTQDTDGRATTGDTPNQDEPTETDDTDERNAEPDIETVKTVGSSPPSSPAPIEPPIREAAESDGFEPARTTTEARPETTTESEPQPTPESDDTGRTDSTIDPDDGLEALRESVERQTELLERNRELLQQLLDRQETERVTDDQ